MKEVRSVITPKHSSKKTPSNTLSHANKSRKTGGAFTRGPNRRGGTNTSCRQPRVWVACHLSNVTYNRLERQFAPKIFRTLVRFCSLMQHGEYLSKQGHKCLWFWGKTFSYYPHETTNGNCSWGCTSLKDMPTSLFTLLSFYRSNYWSIYSSNSRKWCIIAVTISWLQNTRGILTFDFSIAFSTYIFCTTLLEFCDSVLFCIHTRCIITQIW